MKVASEEEITDFDRRVLEAVAIAHRETGAPIITHAAARNRIGEAQAAVFDELGVPPDRVVIGHADDTYDLDYLTGLADRGYVIGMDRIPCGNLPEYGGRTVDDRIGMIVELVDARLRRPGRGQPRRPDLGRAADRRGPGAPPRRQPGRHRVHPSARPAGPARARPRRRGDPPDHGRQPAPLAGR